MFKYFLRPVYLPLQIYLTLKTSDLSVLSHCVSPIHERTEALSDSVWACLLCIRETEKERRGCSLQTPVAVDHYVCVQVSLRVAVGGDKLGRQTKKVERVCVCVWRGFTFRYRYNHKACNIFNSRLSRSVAAFRDLTLSRCRPEQQQTDFIFCN